MFIFTLLLLHQCEAFHFPSNYLVPHCQSKSLQYCSSTAISSHSDTKPLGFAEASQIRTLNGHNAAIHHYQELLLHNPQDTSAATHIAASEESMKLLARIGCPYLQSNDEQTHNFDEEYEIDIDRLNSVLDRSDYRHSLIRKHIFNLPTGVNTNENEDNNNHSLQQYKNDYPFGPTYVRPLVAGQSLDPSQLIDTSHNDSTFGSSDERSWLPSLQCLATLFLLSSCVPKSLFLEVVVGGIATLELLLRLNLVFVKEELGATSRNDGGGEKEWIVPLVHLFPLDVPSKPAANNDGDATSMVLMTDLHPNVLGMTSIPKLNESVGEKYPNDYQEEGAVMYIGPDSLALVQHLHSSIPQYIEGGDMQSTRRILDICTGSGVQALATLAMLDSLQINTAVAVAVDINERALRFTRFNARLNGLDDRVSTMQADLLSGKAINTKDGDDDCSLSNSILKKLMGSKNSQQSLKTAPKFDLLLANPPFIPTPPERSDTPASSIRDEERVKDTHMNAPRYGLFSSGGSSGEDCLKAIVQMTPSLLRYDGGLMAIVSEFMNPPPLLPNEATTSIADDELTHKIEEWWNSQQVPGPYATTRPGASAKGILFTNQYALSSETYAERRAVTNDSEDVKLWKDHLTKSGIYSVSPGLLFVQTASTPNESEEDHDIMGKSLKMKHEFASKTNSGSVWTPHNWQAVECTRDQLSALLSNM